MNRAGARTTNFAQTSVTRLRGHILPVGTRPIRQELPRATASVAERKRSRSEADTGRRTGASFGLCLFGARKPATVFAPRWAELLAVLLRFVEPPGLRAGPSAHPRSAQPETDRIGAVLVPELLRPLGRRPRRGRRISGAWGRRRGRIAVLLRLFRVVRAEASRRGGTHSVFCCQPLPQTPQASSA